MALNTGKGLGSGFTIRQSLLRALLVLVLVISGAFFLLNLRTGRNAVQRLSRSLLMSVSDQTRDRLETFFAPVEDGLLMARAWGERGLIDLGETQELNRLFMPVLEKTPQITSMLIADTGGREYMLLRDGEVWRNRRANLPEWGKRTLWMEWADSEILLEESWKELDYDPARRPWYQGALNRDASLGPNWTEPYAFFTTKDPGMTASIRWGGPKPEDRSYIIAFDVMLRDVSTFTQSLPVSDRGMVMVLDAEEKAVGLPGHPRLHGLSRVKDAVLRPVGDLGIPPCLESVEAWRRAGRREETLFSYPCRGEKWWARFSEYHLAEDRSLRIMVLVPESDLVGDLRRQQRMILLITLAALVLAAGTALGLDRAVRRKIRRMAWHLDTLGPYKLEKRLGTGGMGVVYLARHALLRRPTAIKLLHPGRAMKETALARFEREARLTSRLTHPNTVAIYDYGRTPDNIFYYAMEYLPGLSLDTLVFRLGPLPPGRVINILVQVCGSLAEAHGIGLIHRDVKPANIVLCRRGTLCDVVKVLDFGLVRNLEEEGPELTQETDLSGTPLYLSPEAIRSPARMDGRSDLYSLGAVAYCLVAGRPVFEGRSVVEICGKHLEEIPAPPSNHLEAPLPEDLESLVLRCLAKSPEDRPQSAMELAGLLSRCAAAREWDQEQACRWWSATGDGMVRAEEENVAARDAAAALDLEFHPEDRF